MKDQTNNEYSNGAGCFIRFYWMFIGNALLAITFAFLIQKRPQLPSLLDAASLLAVISLVLVRYVDMRHFEGGTGEGSPATMSHWRKYSAVLVIGSLAIWLGIRVLAPLFL